MVIIAMSTSSSSGYPRILLVALVLAVVAFVLASLQSLPPVLIAVLVFATSVVSSWVSKPEMVRHSTNGNNSSASTVSAKSGDIAEMPTSTDIYNGIAKTLYVGNLPYRANEAAIRKLFAAHGMVLSVRLVKDKETGKRRGYGFVEMPEKDAMQAIAALNESEYLQRTLKVREANEKREQGENFE